MSTSMWYAYQFAMYVWLMPAVNRLKIDWSSQEDNRKTHITMQNKRSEYPTKSVLAQIAVHWRRSNKKLNEFNDMCTWNACHSIFTLYYIQLFVSSYIDLHLMYRLYTIKKKRLNSMYRMMRLVIELCLKLNKKKTVHG